MNVLNAQLLETLKCPSCFDFMKSSIHFCLSGHSLCKTCSMEKSCPVCKRSISDARNHTLETISATVFYPCGHEENGCQQYFQLEELYQHQSVCDHRSYPCRLSKYCAWEGTRDKLRGHYLDKHDGNVLIGKECMCLWKPDKPEDTIHLMMAFDEIFYVNAKIKNDIFYWAVQYIGRSEDVILYYFAIQIFTDQFNDRKLEFSEICHDDVKEDMDDLIDTGFCVAVPLAVLETYMNIEGAVFYKIEIKRA